jgi:hypothetical protein
MSKSHLWLAPDWLLSIHEAGLSVIGDPFVLARASRRPSDPEVETRSSGRCAWTSTRQAPTATPPGGAWLTSQPAGSGSSEPPRWSSVFPPGGSLPGRACRVLATGSSPLPSQ